MNPKEKLKLLNQERAKLVAEIKKVLADEANKDGLTEESDKEVANKQNRIAAIDKERKTLENVIRVEDEQDAIEAQAAADDAANAAAAATQGNRHIPGAPANNGLSEGEKRDLSKLRILDFINGGTQNLSGLAKEVHDEGVKEMDASKVSCQAGAGYACIPRFALEYGSRRNGPGFRADMTTTDGAGGHRIETDIPAIFDPFFESLVTRALGVNYMEGLRGDVKLPVMVHGTAPAHKAENATADEISPTVTATTMTPERLPVFADLSVELQRQDSAGIERWLRNYIGRKLAIEVDKKFFNGSGGTPVPTGLLNTAGLTTVSLGTPNGGAPTFENVIMLEQNVDVGDALMGSLAYVTTPAGKGKLKRTKIDAGSGQFVWGQGDAGLNGYRALASNVLPSDLVEGASGSTLSAIVFGNWADAHIGQWGGIEIFSNPYTKGKEGIIEIIAAIYWNCAFPRIASFAASLDMVTT